MFSTMLAALVFATAFLIGTEGATNCYGSISSIKTSGKRSGSVAASNTHVDSRKTELNSLKQCLQKVGNDLCIEPALLAGIASRETEGGALLDSRGYGRYDSNGYGIMQCDVKASGLKCTKYGPRSCEHMRMMSEFLVRKIKDVQRRRPSWTTEQKLQGGVAAYNRFPPESFSDVDKSTTGNDYSNDVIARAQRLKSQYGF